MPSTRSQAVYNSTLAFTFHCTEPRGENLGLWLIFPEYAHSSGHAQPHTYTLTSRFPDVCCSFSKFPMDISFPSFSFEAFWLTYLPQLLFTTSGRHNVKQLPLIILTNTPGEKAVCTRRAVITSGSFSRLPQNWGGGVGIGQVTMSLFLLRWSYFSWINFPRSLQALC